MFKINLLENPNFISNTDNWTLGSGVSWNTDEIYKGYPTVYFNITGKTVDDETGITSDKLLVRPTEIYSSSIYCRTSDFTLFDGTDSQVSLSLLGYADKESAPVLLGTVGKNKADFPAQDWFRLKLEKITIPTDIHYVSLHATLKRNGKIWLSYPCVELNSVVTDYDPFNTSLYEDYYNDNVYNGITEIQELTKTEDITFNELDEVTNEVTRNLFILTSDSEGLEAFEKDYSITSNEYKEGIDFRRSRLINRSTSFLPYTLTFLRQKLDVLLGVNKYSAYVDYDNHILYVEYTAEDELWNSEISITILGMKPCNLIFRNVPSISVDIKVSEEISLNSFTFNYKPDGTTWKLGEKPFADLQSKGLLKMATNSSIQKQLLNDMAQLATTNVYAVRLSNSSTSHTLSKFAQKSRVGDFGLVDFVISPTILPDMAEITNIKLLDIDGNILTDSIVFLQNTTETLVKHKFAITEG